MLTVVFAAGIPAFLVGGWLADRVPIVSLLLAILGTFTASLFALTIHAGLLWLVVVSAVLGYAIHSLFPVVDTYLLGSLPDRHRASAYAIYSATMMIVQATGSWVVGLLRDAQVPFPWIYRSLALVLTVVLLGLVVSHRLGRLPSTARA
jgi:MFS family permease